MCHYYTVQAFLSGHVLPFNFLETLLVILADVFIHLTIICNLPQNVENLLSNLVQSTINKPKHDITGLSNPVSSCIMH